MLHEIKSKDLTIRIDEYGAVLANVIYNSDSFEFLYQKDPEIWGDQDIAIFPVIDHPRFRVGERHFQCDIKHGIIRHRKADRVESKESSLSMVFSSSEDTIRQYPFEFSFTASFNVSGNRLDVCYEVKNRGHEAMPFYVGGHPGLNAKGGVAHLVLPEEENPEIWLLQDGSVTGHRPFGPLKELLISKDTLKEYKTFILTGFKTNDYILKTEDAIYSISTDAPTIGLWSKPHAGEYVCFEPWWGMAVQKDDDRDFKDKEFVNITNNSMKFGYSITFERQ